MRKKPQIQRVMGIDPGTGRTGWAILEGNRVRQSLIEFGCITTKPNSKPSQRLKIIYEELEELIEKYKPEVVAIEEIYFFKNAKTVIRVAEARGVAVVVFENKGVEVYDYTPLQVKQAVAGYGRAEKSQVERMVKSILKLKDMPKKYDDAVDAVAVGLTHMFTNADMV